MVNITIEAVVEAAEEKILELSFAVSGRLSIKKSKCDIETGATLCRYLRVINGSASLLSYDDLQSILQKCITIGNLKLN